MGKKTNSQSISVKPKIATHFSLGHLQIGLLSSSPLVHQFSRQFLGSWPTAEINPINDDIQIHLELVKRLPALPTGASIYQGEGHHLRDGIGALSVYHQEEGHLLYFRQGGLVQITADDNPIQGYLTVELLRYGRLYDLVITSLSSFLRHHSYYLVHASAAVYKGQAAIFVGSPGCGKSTTVLNLALNDWGVLSNDTLLLEARPDAIYALPTPGGFSIRPTSISHIPALAAYTPHPLPDDFYHLSLSKLNLTWARPAPISHIYFPEVNDKQENQHQPLPPAIALAHLIELSLDRWDKSALPNHFAFLERLSRQAKAASLSIANQRQLPDLLMHNA